MGNILKLAIDGHKPIRGGYDYFWQVILQVTRENPVFTYRDVDGACDFGHEDMLVRFLRLLVKNAFIEIVEEKARIGLPRKYRVLKRQNATPAFSRAGHVGKKGLAQQYLWNTARRLTQGFTVADIALLASTDEVVIAHQTAKDYCRVLELAGLLRVINPNRRQKEHVVYALRRAADTGPKAPVRYRVKLLFDPNTGLVIGDATATEELS